ncbi:MAG TPA: exodeoxyribonuclease VII large subunit [Anaerolineales bacterium]
MSQLAMLGLQDRIWTPGELNRHVRQLLEGDYRLQDLWVAGEIANLSQPASGHLYFSLTDGSANLRCLMWRSEAEGLPRLPRDGEAVEVHGHLSVYEAGGQYQLYADRIRLAGEGELFQEFMRLKQKLEGEGLFDPERKRPLPRWPKRVGVVTSPTGAALRDVLNVLSRRYPLVEVVLSPTPVQGEAAPAAIAQALAALEACDVVLLVRGGGSMEDLWAFNTEQVVRAVAASRAPVVSGIGHETDVILADFAADRRAPTPSAAAEVATPNRQDLAVEIGELTRSLRRAWQGRRQALRQGLRETRAALAAQAPQARLAGARQRLDELAGRTALSLRHRLSLRRASVEALAQTLQAIGPLQVLGRGYALVRLSADEALVRSVGQVSPGAELQVQVSDGSFSAQATAVPTETSEE